MPDPIWFGMWRCGDAVLAATRDEMPERCPEHDAAALYGTSGHPDAVTDYDPRVTRLGFHSAQVGEQVR